MTDEPVKLKRKAKGARPAFFEDPDIDRVVAMLMGLAGELAVVRDRLDTVERLAEAGLPISREAIDAYQPDEAVLAERAATREIMLGEITRVITAEIEGLQDSDDDYDAAVTLVEEAS